MTKEYNGYKIVGSLDYVFATIEKVAPTNATVLIRGESGTGKELVAKAIHHQSKRGDSDLVVVNCGAIPTELLESTLFGHVRGSFTGAVNDRTGLFEQANNGTMFLDEIGDMPPELQVKLFRVLQDGEYQMVGRNRAYHTDVRVIAATNRDLEDMMKRREFREDLYYRLNVIPIGIPPLRERKEDIPELTDHFIMKYTKEDIDVKGNVHICETEEEVKKASSGETIVVVPPDVRATLKCYSWPGNVRQLENAIEYALVMSEREKRAGEDNYFIHIRTEHLPPNVLEDQDPNLALNGFYSQILSFMERTGFDETKFLDGLRRFAFHYYGDSATAAAEALGITPKTIRDTLNGGRTK